MRKTQHTNGIHGSNGLGSGYVHNSRLESKSHAGFYLFMGGLIAAVIGLIAHFAG